MNSISSPPLKKKFFYGWISLAGVSLVIFVGSGVIVNAFSVILPIITKEFDWSRGEVALALTLGILAFGLPSPLFGITVNKFGSRKTIIIGNALAAVGLAGVYFTQEVWHLYLLYILIGLGAGFGGFIASTAMVNNWFIRKRSLALGIFQACAGLGGIVFPPLVTSLISAMGWRSTWLVLAAMSIIFPVIISGILIIRDRPEDMGLTPDGMPPEPEPENKTQPSAANIQGENSGWGILDVMKKPVIWFIGGFIAASSFTVGTLMTHQIAYVQDIGFDKITAATTVSVMFISALVGSLGFGILAMKYRIRYLTMGVFVIQILAMILVLTTRELGLIFLFSILLGISHGALTASLSVFVGEYFPRKYYPQVLGVVFPFQIIANASSASLAGVIFDATSSYTPAFMASLSFSIVGLFFAFMARRPEPDEMMV